MTYLELVNAVLRRLRVTEVNSVTETLYSSLVGDFINDSKSTVENAWDWSALRTTLVVPTVASTSTYTLTSGRTDLKMSDVINDTSNAFMRYQTPQWMRNTLYNGDTITGSPAYYTFNGVDSAGDAKVDVYPIPDGVYSLRFTFTQRTADLVDGADVLLVPTRPVIHLALALAARERGETGGTSTAEYFSMADTHLSDAIALDANRYPDELLWKET